MKNHQRLSFVTSERSQKPRLKNEAKKLEREMITSAQKRGTINSLRKPNPINRGMVAARHPIDRLMSAYKDKIARRRIILNGVNTKSLQPTFAKFLEVIVKSAPAHQNKHWKPNWVLCNPCMYHYTFILKMESFDRDSGAVLKLINSGIDTKINRFNASKHPAPTDYVKMLEEVDSATLEKILSVYYLDFKLFGYDIQPFINILDSKRASEKLSGLNSV